MGFFTGTKVRKCTRHNNAEPCWKCKQVNKQAAQQAKRTGVDPRPRTHHCPDGKTRTMRGGVCPGPHC